MNDFQKKVDGFVISCFGNETRNDKIGRAYRFLEEALELVQAVGGRNEDVDKLADYVFNRPKGELNQELGGVMVTLAALSNAHDLIMENCGYNELTRCYENIEKIRIKHRFKKLKGLFPGIIKEVKP